MAANLAEEIKEVEARSKDIVKDAKNGAAQMINEAQNEVERRTKEAKQKAFRLFKENTASVEREAEEKKNSLLRPLKKSEQLQQYGQKVNSGTMDFEEVIDMAVARIKS